MAQLAIYLDEDTAKLLTKAARKDRVSRSAWVRGAIRLQLENRLPSSFFAVIGSWEDQRDPEEILVSIRQGLDHQDRDEME